jgi:putative photosynthetic complex assembly protein 2
MQHFLYPALFALFVWWFSTGAIIFLDLLPRWTFKYSMGGATAVLAVAFWGIYASRADTSVFGAYCGFSCALLAWGWHEISFYTGIVTGPRKQQCPEGCRGWKHFVHAVQASLWHELAIIAAGAEVIAFTWHQPNRIGLWTFLVLYWMHQSAKLNVLLGVRNLNEQFLPDHLAFLRSFLTSKPMNLLFPVSVTASTVICVMMWNRATAPADSAFTASGMTFVATLMSLAILEHWFLVLPMPSAALWQWGLASKPKQRPFAVHVVAGFLGAGKTTYLRRVLGAPAQGGKTMVLVNDFAALGLDGALLAGQGADVIELPNGCICCSLKADLARQLETTVARHAPDRVLIEPSGVADLAALLGVLAGPTLAPLVTRTEVTTILDAGAFLADFGRMEAHLRAQIEAAGTVIVNKADLVSPATLRLVTETVRATVPYAAILEARFGQTAQAAVPPSAPARAALHLVHDADQSPVATAHANTHAHGLGMASWSTTLSGLCNADALQVVLEAVLQGAYGQVERVKGITRAGDGWIRFDVAGGRSSMAAFAPDGADEAQRVVAIGRHVDEEGLRAAFAACAA